MKRFISFLLAVVVFATGFSYVGEVKAADEKNYVFGTAVREEVDTTDIKYNFTLQKRTKIHIDIKVDSVSGKDPYGLYSYKLDAYFRRQSSLDDSPCDPTWDNDFRYAIEEGGSQSLDLLFQPGDYYFNINRSSNMKYAVAYEFTMTIVEEIEAPTYSGTIKPSAGCHEVQYKLGSVFEAHMYQYTKGEVRYFFSLPHRTQLQLYVWIDKHEGYAKNTTSKFEDYFTIRENDTVYGQNKKWTKLDGTTIDKLVAKAGETDGVIGTITLPAGDYVLVQDVFVYENDFRICLSNGPIQSTKVTTNKSCSVEPGEKFYMTTKAYPENGTAKITYKSSNTKIANVSSSGVITGVKEGTAYVTAYLQNGATAKCKVTVKELTAIATVKSQVGNTCYSNKIYVDFEHTPKKDNKYNPWCIRKDKRTYKIYRATSKNGKYKLIKTMSSKQSWIHSYTDKKVKANKAYYYKVQMKVEGDKNYGPMSKAVCYWTAPSKSVKKTSNGTTVKWKKVSGAKGYLVKEEWTTFLGYNIFFQKVHGTSTTTKMTTSRSYKRKKYTKYASGKKYKSTITIVPYTKHGKYYYAHGHVVSKKKSTYTKSTYKKRVWS